MARAPSSVAPPPPPPRGGVAAALVASSLLVIVSGRGFSISLDGQDPTSAPTPSPTPIFGPQPLSMPTPPGSVAPGQTCTSLENRGTHFTVKISVGTPPADFDVVADTGSDSIIVTSCMCVQSGRCKPESQCFDGLNRSSTFSIEGMEPWQKELPEKLPVVVLTFGSGQVEAVVASDVVQVGFVKAMMDNGVLMMIDQALQLSGPFTGILGLGLPKKAAPVSALATSAAMQGPFGVLSATPPPTDGLSNAEVYHRRRTGFESNSFLQTVGVQRFSICFNDGNADGVLRLGEPQPKFSHGSVGESHWGLDFRGVRVGNSTLEFQTEICNPAYKSEGQLTACGAIPDSGTTVMMAPTDHLKELFAAICDAWPMCNDLVVEKEPQMPSFQKLQVLLARCEEWVGSDGFQSLPTLTFRVAGAAGQEQEIRLPPEAWVLEVLEEEVHYLRKYVMGVVPTREKEVTGKRRKVCTPAFGEQQYNTSLHGPVWIFGAPVFYEYRVVYDLESVPPSVAFVEEECGTCEGDAEPAQPPAQPAPVSFLARSTVVRTRRSSARRWPRQISGPIRVIDINRSRPL